MPKFRPAVDSLERRDAPAAFFGTQIINNGPAVPTTTIVRPFQPVSQTLEPLSSLSAGGRHA